MICDVKSMEDTVREMKYDCVKAPLGKLTLDMYYLWSWMYNMGMILK